MFVLDPRRSASTAPDLDTSLEPAQKEGSIPRVLLPFAGFEDFDLHTIDSGTARGIFWASFFSGRCADCLSALGESGWLDNIVPGFEAAGLLQSDERWYGNISIAGHALRGVQLGEAVLRESARDIGFPPSLYPIFRIASFFVDLGKARVGPQEQAADSDGFRRVRFNNHEKAGAKILQECLESPSRIPGVRRAADILTHAQLRTAQLWIEQSGTAMHKLRIPEEEWAGALSPWLGDEQSSQDATGYATAEKSLRKQGGTARSFHTLVKNLFDPEILSEEISLHEIASGLALLTYLGMRVVEPGEYKADDPEKDWDYWQTRWQVQLDHIPQFLRVLNAAVDEVEKQFVRKEQASSLLWPKDEDALGIPPDERSAIRAYIHQLCESGEITTRFEALAVACLSTASPDDLERVRSLARALPSQRRFRQNLLTLDSVEKFEAFRVEHFHITPYRDVFPDDLALSSALLSGQYPLLLSKFRRDQLTLENVRRLLDEKSFPNLEMLEAYLADHDIDPWEIIEAKAPTFPRAVVHSSVNRRTPVVKIAYGFQSRRPEVGSGTVHIDGRRKAEILNAFRRQDEFEDVAIERFFHDAVIYVAGTAELEYPSQQDPKGHSLITGRVRNTDAPQYSTLVVNRTTDPPSLVTVFFHDRPAKLRKDLDWVLKALAKRLLLTGEPPVEDANPLENLKTVHAAMSSFLEKEEIQFLSWDSLKAYIARAGQSSEARLET